MPIRLGDRPLADFSQPLQMLHDCHRRIEHFLDVLSRVAAECGDGELNDDARRALGTALTYFSEAAPRHTADEEQSLFPRMRTSLDPAVQAALIELDRLEADHRRAEDMHERVDALGRRWLAAGTLADAEFAELRSLLEELTAIYTTHIRQEEERVFVAAARALTANDLQKVGEEMRQRRIG
jgi:hemerythrin-like domain-containing protein